MPLASRYGAKASRRLYFNLGNAKFGVARLVKRLDI